MPISGTGALTMLEIARTSAGKRNRCLTNTMVTGGALVSGTGTLPKLDPALVCGSVGGVLSVRLMGKTKQAITSLKR